MTLWKVPPGDSVQGAVNPCDARSGERSVVPVREVHRLWHVEIFFWGWGNLNLAPFKIGH
jgi:hypothetical protein